MRLTEAQLRLLKRLLDEEGSAVSIETIKPSNPMDGPRFKGLFHHRGCDHCGHTPRESTSWIPIFALAQAGVLKERISGTDYYYASDITHAGRAALAQSEDASRKRENK